MLGYPPTPPPWGARRLTARPGDLQGLGQPEAPPPPLQPPKRLHTPWVTHWLGAAPVWWPQRRRQWCGHDNDNSEQ